MVSKILYRVSLCSWLEKYLSKYMQRRHKEGIPVGWKTRDQIKSSNRSLEKLLRTVCEAVAMHNPGQLFRLPLDGAQVAGQSERWHFQLKLESVLVDSDKSWTNHVTNWIRLFHITNPVFGVRASTKFYGSKIISNFFEQRALPLKI